MGSLALSLCHLAAGRVDAVCSLKAARSVDIAAAQLLVRELGLAIDLFEAPPFGAAPLDLEGRSRVVAAGTPELCARLAAGSLRVRFAPCGSSSSSPPQRSRSRRRPSRLRPRPSRPRITAATHTADADQHDPLALPA